MFCRKCGKEIPDGNTVCESCESSNASVSSQTFDLPPQPQPYIQPDQTDTDSVQKTNGIAIASLVVSIVGFLIGLGIVAIILGIIGQNQIKASMGRQKGAGLAIAGIVVGCIGTVAFIPIILSAILFPVFNNARMKARDSICVQNLKELSIAVSTYSQDYDEKLPPVNKWSDAVMRYTINNRVFRCGAARRLSCAYSFNDKLDKASMQKMVNVSTTPMLFDSKGGWNSALPVSGFDARHCGGYNSSFVDGHAAWVLPKGATATGYKRHETDDSRLND
jgi:prepilin-type processing-associated H-X9-DG protein